ncbi:MAG: hypothetical protein Hens3KO_15100 [Henriciella sp.]
MARRMGKTRKEKGAPRKGSSRQLSIRSAICIIVLIEALALGLKAYDDRGKSIAASETIAQREALAVSEYIKGKADSVRQTMVLAYQAGWGLRQTENSHPDLDAVVSLADALTATPGSRLRDAGETASHVLAVDNTIGLTETNDIVVLFNPEGSGPRIGLVRAENWTPEATGERTFTVLNNIGLENISSPAGTVTGCAEISMSSTSVCVETVRSIFKTSDLVGFAIYALLLAGPALALLGLLKLLEQRRLQSEVFEGEATRAGRILNTVLHEAKAGFWSWNDKTEKLFISKEAARLVGLPSSGEFSASELLELANSEHQDALGQALETLPERRFISQTFSNQDKSVWIDIRARPNSVEGELNGIVLDVTEMRLAAARTKRAQQRLKSALEGFSGPFALWDNRKRIVYWNRAFSRAFGLDETIRVGMSHETVALAQSAVVQERRNRHDDKGSEVFRIRTGEYFKIVERQTQDGSMITMGMDVSADVQNEVELKQQRSKLRKLVMDLERSEGYAGELAKKLNEEKLRAEKSANSKNAFLANMSHELRTPLNAINGFSEILTNQMYGPLGDPRYLEYASDILASGQHLLDMINDILDMAKVDAGKMTVELHPIDLVEPVDAAIRMIRRKAEEKDITLSFVSEDDLPLVDADHRAIRQMILNLVSNAIKFTDDGGKVRVSIDRKDDHIRVAVRDNGVGIPQEAIPRLGQPFEQVADTRDRNYDGTGLGLALTKSFAEMHGGRLTILSQEGKGTQVSFYLPIPKATPARSIDAA